MGSICGACIIEGNQESIEMWFVLLMTFLAMGRAGEAGKSSWSSAFWNFERGGKNFFIVIFLNSYHYFFLYYHV
jgi:hypothetical protein